MYIKRLEIFGFKSFKNKTVLEFEDHEITGVVGPNGCGKSNVVDALLWVMGENSPKNLRGESLSDVIFGGTNKEAPGNLAEVSLVLSRGGSGFPEDYKQFSEVMISRKSYRGGKSEYFINSSPCLLKDIREFFMNTGAGCRGFSIIEQESIEKMITAKPLQRRFIIEEAAGITKFKNRKSESIRKLDLVNQNLKRLDDILSLQETQLNKLTSQAKTAEKYRDLKREIESRKQQVDKREKEDLFYSFQKLKSGQESLKLKKADKERAAASLEEKISEEKAFLEKARQTEVERKMEESGLAGKVKAFEMIESLSVRQKALQEKERAIKKDLKSLDEAAAAESSVEELSEELIKLQRRAEEIKRGKKEVEINLNGFQKQIQFIEREIELLSEEEQNIKTAIQKNINEKNKTLSLLQKQEQLSLNFGREEARISADEQAMEKKREALFREVSSLNHSLSALKYKIDEMNKLIFRFENLNEGANELKKNNPEEFQTLFQNLKAEPGYDLALGAVLGVFAQALIPQGGDFELGQAVKKLKEGRKGKTCFLSSLSGLPAPPDIEQKLKNYPAFICFLSEKAACNMHTEPLRELLKQTAVVSDFNSGLELKKQFPFLQFVTKEGDLITRDSFILAGSTDKETNLFEIRSRLEGFAKEASSKETALKVQKAALEAAEKRLKHIQQQKKSLQSENSQSAESLISIKKDIERMEKELLQLSERRKKNNKRIEEFQKEKENLLEHEQAGQKEKEEMEQALSLKESQLQELLSQKEKHSAAQLQRNQIEKEILDNAKDQQSLNQEAALLLNLAGSAQTEAGKPSDLDSGASFNLEEEISRIQEKRKELSAKLASSQQDIREQAQAIEDREGRIADFEKEFFQTKMNINNLTSESEKKELEKTYLKQKFLENYGQPLEDFTPPSSSEELPLEKLKSEISHFEKQLDRIKEINFLALEEYEKLSKENFFLNSQRDDLVNSRRELMKVISRIDGICAVRFKDMLEEINKRFSKVFPIVFQGDNARAELILREAAEESSEPGVDILVHPPGKRPQSISLLSRGEKALTSVCLIYSLFLVKPSPFCIIDEADAPLDDANILRFLSVLKEMARKSQIIAITHNKYTMQACSRLYGVTMKRPGVSQIVSVDMSQKEFLSDSGLSLK